LISITDAAPFAYITNNNNWAEHIGTTVSIIDTAKNKVISTVPVGWGPIGIAVTPDGKKAYIANGNFSKSVGNVSVIDTASNAVTVTVDVGDSLLEL
jgi:YVTN family beta-propeller protein